MFSLILGLLVCPRTSRAMRMTTPLKHTKRRRGLSTFKEAECTYFRTALGTAMVLNTDLDEAARMATREMIDFLVSEKHLSRDDAYILCSLAVDLRVTQVVDQAKGVHAMLPKSLFVSK